MKIIVKDNYSEMSKLAASVIADLVRKKPDCVLGLATGATPIGTYHELARLHKEEGLDFSAVTTFNLDEYLGISMDLTLPYEMDQSYARFMHEELFKKINIKKKNAHVPYGLATDPDKYCKEYEKMIADAGGLDLQLLGIGGDGHIGFNEPGSSFDSRTRVEHLNQKSIDDNYEAFYKKAGVSKEEMPKKAITMGVATIMEAKSLLMIVSGIGKADIIQKALEGPVTTQITASAIQIFKRDVTVILDKPAASKLKKL
ncbi:MAG TPA: glucosamine-6-phosphate deaminase [Clostridia bacterium]|jgi:glucosamine-6-phosphate deaminase|nr:glucosamine-6-phosphate deaminase [Clostridiaceae bacterium]HOF26639.1 glucosamine-6-phosphate deaminase [Clostridia bacterium]HOM34332.1 glucosamine-6-phosphate deaminase [Clostridia bacterium]HOR89362.1 glucosamine-6-phosphate deaminase [Clostridia bacterium]HOT71021.1 glucosamine-6-phosphate deaminase [Clostridia bacterium]